MCPDSSDTPHATAITQLRHLGLSTYAARTFVALIGIERATAKEVSEVSDVPRTKVYEAVDELREIGLVDVVQSTPKRFRAVSVESTGRKFRSDLQRRADLLVAALETLRGTDHDEQRGVWTASGHEAVTERVVAFIEAADEEVVYASVADVLDQRVIDALAAADDRGVSIGVAGCSSTVAERIVAAAPEATVVDSPWSDTPIDRLLLVDGSRTLASVRRADGDSDDDADATETAIWAVGESNSLVAVFEAMVAHGAADSSADDSPIDGEDDGESPDL